MASVTIKDVARVARVSVATVSRALNGRNNVAAEVRSRVEAAARDLRYTPHAGARSLSSRRTHALGVVLPELCSDFFAELVRGFDQAARHHGLHLLVSSGHGGAQEQCAALRAMRSRVDGLLVMSPFAETFVAFAEELDGLPVVLVNSHAAVDVPSLQVDNHAGAFAMVEHLVGCGYCRIAFIDGPECSFDAHERRRGYRDALAQLLPKASEWIVPGAFDEASGFRAGQTLLASRIRPDAVFAANDMMALGCLCAFAQAGIKVPTEIALAGFGDIPLAHYAHPGLTTMRVDIAEVGERAVQMLIAQIGGDTEAASTAVVTPRLVVRESSGPRRLVGAR